MAELKMGKDGFPVVTEEARESPWWLPLLGIFVMAVAFGWVALTLTGKDAKPSSITVEILAPEPGE